MKKYSFKGRLFTDEDIDLLDFLVQEREVTAEQVKERFYSDRINGYELAVEKMRSLQDRLQQAFAPLRIVRISGHGRGHMAKYRILGGKRSLNAFARKLKQGEGK